MKQIGIVGWNLGENSFGASKPYLEYLSKFGQVSILGPNTLANIDLLVLPGGKDVVHGNNKISFWTGAPDQFLEHFDKYMLPQYIDRGTPILGICRGMQTLMRHVGVPLVQDIDWLHGYSKDEEDTKTNTLEYTPKYQWMAKQYRTSKVGSWHHQCAMIEDVRNADGWDVVAHTKDGVCEYTRHRAMPIWGIQSHPERNQNELDAFIITSLLG